MSTVTQIVQRLLPTGSRREASETCAVDWSQPPTWPPDLFAVAATLVNLSGCYAHIHASNQTVDDLNRVRRLGEIWCSLNEAELPALTERLRELWSVLLRAGHEHAACFTEAELPGWCRAALELMAIADEASAGIGFGADTPLAARAIRRHWTPLLDQPVSTQRRSTATLCELVPPEECCVQPKCRTPQIGCTLRSLSHHLALLPPLGEVTSRFLVRPDPPRADEAALNLLLIPFPYEMGSDAFVSVEEHRDEQW
jgi:hypothetical protein